MDKITLRPGSAYYRRSFLATAGVALLLAGASGVRLQAQNAGSAQPPAATSGSRQTGTPTTGTTPTPGQTTTPTTQPGSAGTTQPPTGGTNRGGGFGGGGGGFQRRGNRGGGGTRGAGQPITLDLHGVDITNLLRIFANAYQMPVVADPAVTGPVTVYAPNPVPLDEAFKILQQVLRVRGFTAQIVDGVITIMPTKGATPASVFTTVDPKQMDTKNQVITQVIPIENVDADQMAKELQPLVNPGAVLTSSIGTNAIVVTDSSENVKRMIDLVAALDKTSSRAEMAVYNLHHAEASNVADLINNLYGRIAPRPAGAGAQAGQPGGGGNPFGGNPFNPFGGGGGRNQANGNSSVVAIAEPGTNSLIVVAPRDTQEQITQNIINKLDDDDTANLGTQMRKIKYADATVLANTINQVLSDAHGAASSSTGNRGAGGIFGGFAALFGGGQSSSNNGQVQSTDPFAKVTPEARTNSVLITASTEKMVKINSMIDELDVNITTQSTTFVIPLSYAQADDIAAALTSAFSSTGTGSVYNPQFTGAIGGNGSKGGSGGGLSGHSPIERRPTTSTTGGRAARGLIQRNGQTLPPGPPNAPDGGYQGDGYTNQYGASAFPSGVQGVMTENGFIPNDPYAGNSFGAAPTRQFGGQGGRGGGGGFNGGGFGGQANRGGQTVGQPLGGPGQNGSFSALLQLQGNVVAVASPNGDSIIVTTTPNNYEAIKGIVAALDTVPRQVLIEVIVAEVDLTTDSKMGFNMTNAISGLGGASGSTLLSLPATGFGTSTTPDPTQMGLQAVISSANHSGLIQALGTDTKVRVLATPSVFTSNNQPAIVDIATQVPYITGQALSTLSTTASSVVTNTVDFASIGFTLYVTPRITRDGQVTVDCVADASDLVANLVLGSGANAVTAPEFDDRYTDTTVTVKDGDTAVIGGLIQDRQTLTINKVPVLSDIPILGQFFRSREKQRTRVELMIFLTPHVVASSDQATALANQKGASVIRQMSDLHEQQPNLKVTPEVKKGGTTGTTGTATTGTGTTPPPTTGTGTTPATTPGAGLDPSGKPIPTGQGTPPPAGTSGGGTTPAPAPGSAPSGPPPPP